MKAPALAAIAIAIEQNKLFLSAVTLWEIDTLSRRTGKTSALFQGDTAAWVTDALIRLPLTVVAFEAEDAQALYRLPEMHADPADRMLTATARRRDVPFVTDDRKLIALGKRDHLKIIAC